MKLNLTAAFIIGLLVGLVKSDDDPETVGQSCEWTECHKLAKKTGPCYGAPFPETCACMELTAYTAYTDCLNACPDGPIEDPYCTEHVKRDLTDVNEDLAEPEPARDLETRQVFERVIHVIEDKLEKRKDKHTKTLRGGHTMGFCGVPGSPCGKSIIPTPAGGQDAGTQSRVATTLVTSAVAV